MSTQSKYLNKMLRLSAVHRHNLMGGGVPYIVTPDQPVEVEKPKMSYSLGSTGLLPLGRGSSGAGPPPLLRIKAENGEEDLSCCCDRVKSASLLCTVHKRSNMINDEAHKDKDKDQDQDNDQNQY